MNLRNTSIKNGNQDKFGYDANTMYCNVPALNIRKGPSSNEPIVGYLKKNDKIQVISQLSTGWSRIKYNNIYAYVSSQYLSTNLNSHLDSNTKFLKCNIDLLPLRMGPSNSERIIGRLKNNDKVEVVYHVSTGWTKIKYFNRYAYANTSYLCEV